MNPEEKEDILRVLVRAVDAIKNKDMVTLKNVSDHTLHKAATLQDDDSVGTAVLIYTLSKIFEREKYKEYPDWPILYTTIIENLNQGIDNIKNNRFLEYEGNMRNIFNVIDRLSSHLKRYIDEVIEKAKVHKASRIHEHGISVGRTASILGISQWELMDYIGKTGISDTELSITKDIKERLRTVRSIFK